MKFAQPLVRTLVALALACATGAVWAQTASGATPTVSSTPAPATASKPTDKLVSTFSDFSGSPDNAASLVNGLRTGSPITLSGPTGGSPSGEALTFSAPTRPMGYGNIRIALSLAQTQLASQGITNPTPAQLQGALMGTSVVGSTGSTTTTQGILQMRASGMGWGQIANSMGYKLGPVMSGKQTFTATTVSATGTTTRASGGTVVHGKSSITTAGGGSINAGGHGGSHGKSHTVTAAGASGGSGVSTGLGHGHAAGTSAGVVSAAGGKAGAGGQGAAHGKGGGKP